MCHPLTQSPRRKSEDRKQLASEIIHLRIMNLNINLKILKLKAKMNIPITSDDSKEP